MSRHLCASALVATAAIHLAVVPEHAEEWPAAAAFFVVLALVEVALAVAALRRELRIRRRLAAIHPLTPTEAARRRPTRARVTIGDRP
jgi:hypothetical protein